MRAQIDFPVIQHVDGFGHACRGIDISSRGLVVRRPARLLERDPRLLYSLELRIGDRSIRTLARTVWTEGPLQAMRYVGMSDADRLEIAEELDRARRGGAVLH
jgi:hypothetical protein